MAHDSSLKRNLVLAVPRVGLALVLGVVIATPLTLQVFHREIDTQIVALQAEKSDAYQRALDSDARFAGLPEPAGAGGDRAGDRRQRRSRRPRPRRRARRGDGAAGRLRPGREHLPGARGAGAVRARRDLWHRRRRHRDGVPGGAGCRRRAGRRHGGRTVGPGRGLAAASAAEARSAQLASSDLETHQAELDRLTEDQTRLQAAFDATNGGSGGILLRLEALSRLSDTNGTLWAAQVMLSLLFMCVEILPVLMKLLLNFSPPSTYDRLAAMRDSADLDVEGLQQQARRTVEQAQNELLVLAEKERVDRQKDAVLARRRLRIAQQTVPPSPEVQEAAREANTADTGRQLWDTGPLRLARSAAGRTVRSVRRATERVPTA